MAEDKKEATGKDKKGGKEGGKEGAAASPAASGGGLPLGAIAAGVVLLLIGGGLGIGGSLVVAKWAGGTAEAKSEGGAAKAPEAEHAKAGEVAIHEMTEIELHDLMSNIRNQQGRRFVKVSCAVYLSNADAKAFGLVGGGEGGANAGANIKRIMQQALEEHLKGYDMDELTGPNIYIQLKKGFREALDVALQDVFKIPREKRLVERIVLTNLLVQ